MARPVTYPAPIEPLVQFVRALRSVCRDSGAPGAGAGPGPIAGRCG